MLKSAKLLPLAGASALLAVAGLSGQALAQGSDTTSFDVTITIANSCDVHSTAPADIDFGTVNWLSQTAEQSTQLNIQCTKGADATIALSPQSTASSDGSGFMVGQTTSNNHILYHLYQDQAASQPFGEGNDAKHYVGTGQPDQIPVYATLDAGQPEQPADSYKDTVTVNVTY